MIRNAVLHLANEQPLLVDLFSPPAASDVSLVCTNLRTLNGKRPVFADHEDSLFVFPYTHIRFVEVTARALADAGPLLVAGGNGTPNGASNGSELVALLAARRDDEPRAVGDTDAADGTSDAGDAEPDAEAEPAGPVDDLDEELEIDEDFLRRVREV